MATAVVSEGNMAMVAWRKCLNMGEKLVRIRQLAVVVLLTCLCVVLSGCPSARINQFRTFAQAGIAYVDAADAVLTEAGALVVDENSDNLVMARDGLTQEQRKDQILAANDQVRRHLAILNDIRRHCRLLRDYFAALSALAESDAPTQISKSADNLYASLQKLHPRIEEATVFDRPVKPLIQPAVKLVFVYHQRAQLEKELMARGEDIERELALQHAAMRAVTDGMRGRLEQSLLPGQESTLVVLPYVDKQDPPQKPPKNKLPKNWNDDRRRILTAKASINSITVAAEAADKLRGSFTKLVRNDLSFSDLQLMIQDINEVLAFIEMLKTNEEK